MTLTEDIIPGSMALVKAFSEKTAGIAKKVSWPPKSPFVRKNSLLSGIFDGYDALQVIEKAPPSLIGRAGRGPMEWNFY